MIRPRSMLLIFLVFTLLSLAACTESEIPDPTVAPATVQSSMTPTVPTVEATATATVEVPTPTSTETPEVVTPEETAVPAESTVVSTDGLIDGEHLQVVGNKFFYKGEETRLVCISIGEIAEFYMPEFGWTDYRVQFREMKAWGANCVRLSVHPGYWETRYEYESELLRELIDIATEEEMIVIVDWHVIGWPGTFSATDTWHDDMILYNSDFDLAKSFSDEISADYMDYDNIILEIWNEAIHPDAMEELPEFSWWPILKIKHEELIEVIRANGNTSPILVSGPSWSYDLRGIKDDPPNDPASQLAYSWHLYAGNGGDDPRVWEVALDGLNEVAPIVLAEMGFDPETEEHWRGTEEVYGVNIKKMIIDKGLNPGAWCWNPYYGPALWSEHDASRMTNLGVWVHNFFSQELD